MAIALNGEKERISVHEEHAWQPNLDSSDLFSAPDLTIGIGPQIRYRDYLTNNIRIS